MNSNMLAANEMIHDLLGFKNRKIIQRTDRFHFSLDTVLLADFVRFSGRQKKVLDLGTGNGPIPLFLSAKSRAHITGIELQEDMVELARKNVTLNQLDNQITILHLDIKAVSSQFPSSHFDIVTCNPPFFKVPKQAHLNENQALSVSRHELTIDLGGIMQAARHALKQNGALYMVHRAARLQDIIIACETARFKLKRGRLVYPKAKSEAMMVLLEFRFDAKSDALFEPPLIVHDEDGTYTEEVQAIFTNREAL